MTKAEILSEIKRTAAQNGGVPLGARTFEQKTGIRSADWLGIHWRSWGDAVREAGLQANSLTPRIAEEHLLKRYAQLTRELGRAPTKMDLRMMKRRDPTFPSEASLVRRFGSYQSLRSGTQAWCAQRSDFVDIANMLAASPRGARLNEASQAADVPLGFVYLVKHGSRSEYKIGRTLNPIRREGEMRMQLPEKLRPVHYIETDDPAGVESYWHSRFAAKRKQGEWFALTPDDVRAFKKWKRIS